MKAEMNRQAEQYIRQSKTKSRIVKIVTVLSVLVALITTYILILPGITMEYGMVCGLEEHQHSEACYTQGIVCGQEERESVTTETVSMVCQVSPHTHTNECFNDSNVRICGTSTELFHAHNSFCYDGEGNLICSLPDNARHEHVESCYRTEQKLTCQEKETAGHQHTAACKTQTVASEPACGQMESAGHVHGETCYTPVLSCTLAQSEGHIHGESCSKVESTLVCTKGETPAHSHGTACYNDQNQLICELAEGGHTHEDTCYAQTTSLICGKEAGEGAHTHGADCYTTQLTCTIPEGEGAHEHTDDCYPMVESIICGMEAGQGAHVHQDACYTSTKLLDCTILHQHTDECFEKDSDGRACAICGIDEVPEHIHGEACREVITSTIEGHTHTEECNGSVQLCQLAEHTHVDACYPQEEAVVTATPEPTATVAPASEPAVTAEVTATITPAPAAQQEETIYLCGIPEHRHSADCLDETGSLVCGYAMDHLHGELCLVDLTNATFYCGLQEHLHGALCFDATGSLICSVEPEHRHGYECLEDPDAIQYYCGMEEHFHGELCYDENDLLTCNETEHFHSADCRYACNKEEHTHSHTASGGVMLLSLEEVSGCYDADGNLICTLEEHTHSAVCNTVLKSADSPVVLADSAIPLDASNFGNYVDAVVVHTDGKYDDIYKPQYDPDRDAYATSIDINFSIPNSVLLDDGVYVFHYNLPKEVGVVDESIYNDTFLIINSSGIEVGYFTIARNDDGTHYLSIHFYPEKVDQNTDCSGTLYFKCSIDGDATQEDGSIRVEFEKEAIFDVKAEDITRNENESALYSISTEKTGGNNGTAYDPATNKLTYQVSVKTKGTPDVIKLTDNLNVSGLEIQSQQVTSVQLINNGQTSNVTDYTVTQNGTNTEFTLPKVEASSVPDGQVAEYLITYELQLSDAGYENVYLHANNSVTAISGQGTPNEVKDSDSVQESHEQKMLEKTGSYNAADDLLQWKIIFNNSGKNITGMKLTDQMLATLSSASDITVTPATGFNYQYGSNGEITGILFTGDSNTEKYEIVYYTQPSLDYAGNYAQANKVTILDPNDVPVVEDEHTVNGINRNESVSKSVASSAIASDKKSMTIDWKVEIPIDSNGLGNDVIVSDSMSPNGRHYMTYDQLMGLYNQISSMLEKDESGKSAMTVNVITSEPGSANVTTAEVNIDDVMAGDYSGAFFGALKFTLDKDSADIASLRDTTLTFQYSSTANTDGLTTNSQFGNWLGVGDTGNESSYAYVDYVADVTNPVSKYCGDDGHTNGEQCGWEHQNNNPFSWGISVYQNDTYESIRVEDTLPEGTELTDVYVGQNLQTKLTFDPAAQKDSEGFIAFTVSDKYDTPGLVISGKYNPDTRKIVVVVEEDDDPNTDASIQYGTGKTLKLKVRAHLTDDQMPAPGETKRYELLNTANVFVTQNGTESPYDDDDHKYILKVSAPELVVKKDMNWQENDSVIQNYKPNEFGWIVEVKQDQEYDQLVITDTLPADLIFTGIKVGSSTIDVERSEDGSITLTPQLHSEEEGLLIEPVYDAATGKVTITVKRNPDSELKDNPDNTKGYGEDQTLYVRYYFNIPEDQLASENNPSVSNSYTNHISVDFTKGEEITTGVDDQTITTQFTYNPPVVKYGVANHQESEADIAVNNSTGQLVWKVLIRGANQYDTIIIEDQLPAGIIELDPTAANGVIQLQQYSGFYLQLGDSTDDGVTYPLVAVNIYNQNEVLGGYEASYNAKTGKISIKLDGNVWRQYGVLNNSDAALIFNCRVTEAYMPNVEDGQYSKDLGGVTNNVTVSTENGELGHDSQTQNVTVTQNRPDFTPADKASPVFDGSKTLHYSVDINPSQQDMDPAKNSVTLVDQLSYSQTDPVYQFFYQLRADRVLTLQTDTVKLYYADYDENGQPLMQDGRLVPGEEVDPAKWTMEYTEDNNAQVNGFNNAATRTMTLTVPDSRALVLVYDYQVSMNNDSVYDNVPLNVKNSVQVKGYESKGDQSETSNSDVWNASGGGGNTWGSPMALIKHDAANQGNVLAGVEFRMEAYVNGAWSEVSTLVTDAEGKIGVNAPSMYGGPQNLVAFDRLYRVVESKTVTGYELPDPAPAYYFYWSGYESGNNIAVPEGVDISTVPNLWHNGLTFYAPNQKKATTLGVEKVWLNPDGSLMSDRDKPSSVMVDLHRYAIPEADWNNLLAQTDGKINGVLAEGVENTNVTITIANSGYSHNMDPVATVTAAVGSTLEFDVVVKQYGIGTTEVWRNYPSFEGLEASSYQVVNKQDVYHYRVTVTKDLELSGVFTTGSNSWEVWNQDNISNYVEIQNIVATKGVPADNSVYASLLQPYVDRSYVLSMKLTSEGDWQGLWENLDLVGEVVNADGTTAKVHYKYYVTETSPDGYSTQISGYSSDDGGKFVVENRKDGSRTEKTNIRVYKKWFGANGEEYTYNKETGLWSDTSGVQYAYENEKWYTLSGETRTEITDEDKLAQMPLPSVSIRLLRKDLLAGDDAQWENYIYNQNAATVINDRTNWMYNFVDLPARTYNSSGQLVESYDYFIEEVTEGDFTVELVQSGTEEDANGRKFDVITVKNSAIRNISVAVQKVWADGSKPENDANVTVVLSRMVYTENGYVEDTSFASEAQQNGWLTEVTLNGTNSWFYQWDQLPNGKAATDTEAMKSYSYMITEMKVNGVPVDQTLFDVSYDHEGGRAPANGILTITNTKVIPKTEVTVEKVWKDAQGNVVQAPADVDSITLQLKRKAGENGATEDVQQVVLNADNRWKLLITDLEKFVPINGEPSDTAFVYYFVEQNIPAGYSVSYSNSSDGVHFAAPENGLVTVTNREATNLTISKRWQNTAGASTSPAKDKVYLQLQQNGQPYTGLSAEINGVALQDGYIVLSPENNWYAGVNHLPETDSNGTAYTYSFKEFLYENGSYTEVTDAVITPASGNASTTFTVTNTTTGISLKKKWKNADGSNFAPEAGTTVVFKLMRRSSNGGVDTEVQQITLNGTEPTPWTAIVEHLPAKGANGESYSYYFVESELDDSYSVTYSNSTDGITFTAVNDEEVIVTNTKTTCLSVEKQWAEGTPEADSITIQLYQAVEDGAGGSEPGGGTDTPVNPDDAETAYVQLAITIQDTGLPCVYEVDASGNEVHAYLNAEFAVGSYGMLEATWYNSSTWKPDITKCSTSSTVGSTKCDLNEQSVDATRSTYYIDLGQITSGGTVEFKVDNYFNANADGSSTWSFRYYTYDPGDSASYSTRSGAVLPEGATSYGPAVTITAENNWKHTFSGLPATNANGDPVCYYVVETQTSPEGYTASYTGNGADSNGTIVIINTRDEIIDEVFTTTDLIITKVWENAADYKPESLRFLVTATDTITTDAQLEEYEVLIPLNSEKPAAICEALVAKGVTMEVVEAEDGSDSWTLTIKGLPDTRTVNDSLVYDYIYSVAELEAGGFTSAHTGDAASGYVFTNTRSVITASVDKQWAEGTPANKPAVTMTLYRYIEQDGMRLDEQVLLDGVTNPVVLNGSETQPWHHSWENLPTYGRMNGTVDDVQTTLTGAYTYYVSEAPVEGYTSVSNPADGTLAQDGTVIFVNTPTQLKVEKRWGSGVQKQTVQFTLWRRSVSASQSLTCTACGTVVTTADAHADACGHYTCQSDYHNAVHTQCSCGGYLCDGGNHTSCGAGEQVTITFKVWIPRSESKAVVQTHEFAKGTTVTWNMSTTSWSPDNGGTATYSDESGTQSRSVSIQKPGTEAAYTATFTADYSGVIEWDTGHWYGNESDWTFQFTTTSALSTISSTTSETVDTTGAERYGTYEITEDNQWQQIIYGLPAASADGSVKYQYFVEELDADSYIVSYQNNGGIAPENDASIVITNLEPEAEYASLTVNKRWLDSNGLEVNAPNYAVHYELRAQGEDAAVTQGVLNKENNWTAEHTGLDPDTAYYVVETSVKNGETEMLPLYDVIYLSADGNTYAQAADAAVTGSGTLTVINTLKTTYSLPETGGTGTYPYTGAGVLLLCTALTLLYINNVRKRRANE